MKSEICSHVVVHLLQIPKNQIINTRCSVFSLFIAHYVWSSLICIWTINTIGNFMISSANKLPRKKKQICTMAERSCHCNVSNIQLDAYNPYISREMNTPSSQKDAMNSLNFKRSEMFFSNRMHRNSNLIALSWFVFY